MSPLQLRVYERLIASEDFQAAGLHHFTRQLNVSAVGGTRDI